MTILIFTTLILTSCGVLSRGDRQVKLPLPPCPDSSVDVTWYGPRSMTFTDGTVRQLYAMDIEDRKVLDEWIKAWISCSIKRGEVIKVLNGD